MSKTVRALLGLAITGLFLWLFFRQIELDAVGQALGRLSVLSIVAALACLAAGYTFRILRWWLMLRAVSPAVRPGQCAWPFLVSIAANNLLPLRAGDVARVFAFRRQLDAPAMGVLGTVVLERLLDLIALSALFFVLLSQVPEDWAVSRLVDVVAWAGGIGVLVLFGLVLLAPRAESLLRWLINRLPGSLGGRGENIEGYGAQVFAAIGLVRSPVFALQLAALTAICWAFEAGVFVAVAASVAPDLWQGGGPWFSLSTGTLATMLPSSPGYVGTFDYFAMEGLCAFGAPESVGAAFAVSVHLILWLPLTLAGGLYFLAPAGRALRRAMRSEPSES